VWGSARGGVLRELIVRRAWARRAAQAALLTATSVVLSLGAMELALRLLHPAWTIPYPPVCYRPDLFERHDPYGYRLRPGRSFQHGWPTAGGRTVTFTSNAQGFRSAHDFTVADDQTRIVILGDSMVFGVGVDASERFTEILETLEPTWRLDNLGMVAYGPDLMLRALEAVGLSIPPDVVVFAIFSHDFYRVAPEGMGVGFPIPRFVLENGALATVPYPIRPAWQGLFMVQGVRYLHWRYTDASFPLNAAILARFLELAGKHRFHPAVVFVPGPQERWDDRRRRSWLRAWTAARNTAFFDLSEPLDHAGKPGLYIPADAHWNPGGHRVAAEALRPFLQRLVSTGPDSRPRGTDRDSGPP
jgi:hypothetical protein